MSEGSPGWDSREIHRIAREHYGGLEQMFEHHGWPERGEQMMTSVQTHVATHYGDVKEFVRRHSPPPVMDTGESTGSGATIGEKLREAAAEAAEREAETASAMATPESVTSAAFASLSSDGAGPVLDEKGRAYGTGRRKESVSRVWIGPGSGKIQINGRAAEHYFPRAAQRIHALTPLKLTDHMSDMDVYATVRGGGVSGQAGALRHGLARALRSYNPELRRVLRVNGLLTRDPRAVERKKYGRHKARRSTQYSKR